MVNFKDFKRYNEKIRTLKNRGQKLWCISAILYTRLENGEPLVKYSGVIVYDAIKELKEDIKGKYFIHTVASDYEV